MTKKKSTEENICGDCIFLKGTFCKYFGEYREPYYEHKEYDCFEPETLEVLENLNNKVMTIEELENKILDGDFDEYTLDEYRAKICNEQKNRYIDKACEVYRKELKEIIDTFNTLGKQLYNIEELGELIHLEGSVKDFHKAMNREEC